MNEVNGAVMGASVGVIFKDTIRIRGEPAIGKEQQLDPLKQLIIRQKQKIFAALLQPIAHSDFHLITKFIRGDQFMSVLLTFQESNVSKIRLLRNYVSYFGYFAQLLKILAKRRRKWLVDTMIATV
jgi:hypothetical protein